jgi:hypothetical protein
MPEALPSLFQQWRDADAMARQEERRLFHKALSSVDDGVAPQDSEWIFCGELRSAADSLFYRATSVSNGPLPPSI